MNESAEIIDSENYKKNQEKKTFKDIIYNQVQKIMNLTCCEHRGGFYELKPIKIKEGVSTLHKVWVENKATSYCNAVDGLHDLLIFHFDKPMKEYLTSNQQGKNEGITQKFEGKRKLFQELIKFLFRNKLLEEESYEDKGETWESPEA